MSKHTPGPWRWAGEDYRGGWGWQLLVGPDGQGIACGSDGDRPYHGLRAHSPIDPELCQTGFMAGPDSAPSIHVREVDARLIAAAPDLLEALRAVLECAEYGDVRQDADVWADVRAAIAKATGEQP